MALKPHYSGACAKLVRPPAVPPAKPALLKYLACREEGNLVGYIQWLEARPKRPEVRRLYFAIRDF